MVSAVRRSFVALACLLTLAACTSPAAEPAPPSTPSPSSTPPSTSPSTSSVPPVESTPVPPPAAKRMVVLDPGHNGGNAAAPEQINRPVPAGRGRTKACNTTGTATNAGYPEHAFTWDVALRVRELLADAGFEVVLTRPDDTGVGPCVDERAAIGNRNAAAAVVSIHADGSTAPGATGFHIAYSAPPLNPAQTDQTFATTMRDAFAAAGFAPSTYIGSAGLSPRDDLGGLNLSEVPAVLVECGNMRDAAEAAAFASDPGRQSYAAAIAAGVLAYLK